MTKFEPDVGVLVVHGIGTQKEGAELRHWVDSIIDYLDAFPPAPQAASSPRILQPSPTDKFVRLHTPPLGGAADADRQRWLIGEAWWAEAFDVPDRKEVSRWLAGLSSWFLYLFAVRVWRRFHVDAFHIAVGLAFAGSVFWLLRQVAGAGADAPAWIALVVTGIALACTPIRKGKRLGAVVVAATVLIGYPLAAIGAVATIALWLVGLVPGKVGDQARAAQLGIAQSVGDVYALIASRRREQAMFDAISAGAERLATAPGMAGKPLVLLSHSQGAALTYRGLNKDSGLRHALAGRRVTVVTYGAALVPIHLLEHRLRGPKSRWQWLQGLAGLSGLLLFVFTLARVAADGVDPLTRLVTGVSVVLVVPSFLATWRQEAKARGKNDAVTVEPGPPPAGEADEVRIRLRSPDGARLRWVDLWAPWDPVPNGPLSVTTPCSPPPCGPGGLAPPGDGNEFVSCRVANVHQPWKDHVVYRDNPEDVVSRWVGEIAARAKPGLAPAAVDRPGRPAGAATPARNWRLWRGVALFLGQLVALVVGFIAVTKHWDDLDDLGRRAARRFPLRSTLTSIADAVPDGVRDGALGETRDSSHLQGLLVALAALLVLIAAGSWVVSRWQGGATRAYAGGQTDDVVRRGGLAASVVAALVVAGALVWAIGPLKIGRVPTRSARVYPATLAAPSATGPTSPRTKIRFEPVGTGDDTPVVVDVGDGTGRVDLDAGLDYRITATATGGKDCTVSTTPAGDLTEVRVSCAPSGMPLPRSSR